MLQQQDRDYQGSVPTCLLLELAKGCFSSCFAVVDEPCWELQREEQCEAQMWKMCGQRRFVPQSMDSSFQEFHQAQLASITWLPCVGRNCDSSMTLRGCSFACTYRQQGSMAHQLFNVNKLSPTPPSAKALLGSQRLTKVMIATPSTSPCLDVRSADSQNRTLRVQKLDKPSLPKHDAPITLKQCASSVNSVVLTDYPSTKSKICLPPTRVLVCDAFQSKPPETMGSKVLLFQHL